MARGVESFLNIFDNFFLYDTARWARFQLSSLGAWQGVGGWGPGLTYFLWSGAQTHLASLCSSPETHLVFILLVTWDSPGFRLWSGINLSVCCHGLGFFLSFLFLNNNFSECCGVVFVFRLSFSFPAAQCWSMAVGGADLLSVKLESESPGLYSAHHLRLTWLEPAHQLTPTCSLFSSS